MSALLVVTYDVSDADRFADYNPGSLKALRATIDKHGGEVLAGGLADITVGTGQEKCVVIAFPDAEAAKAWQDDDEYAPLKAIRYESTTNITELIVGGS